MNKRLLILYKKLTYLVKMYTKKLNNRTNYYSNKIKFQTSDIIKKMIFKLLKY